jgi:hypothetical protein
MYEELMSIEETRRAWELRRYFVVRPAYGSIYRNIEYNYADIIQKEVRNPYHSDNETPLSREHLAKFLRDNNLLEEDPAEIQHPAERFWPDTSSQI